MPLTIVGVESPGFAFFAKFPNVVDFGMGKVAVNGI
jgi:hypothetical protein